ncbi:hypothetical protein [Rhodoferax sp.]|uniref:hypothetical protein n=1 Tax=Rhodoferax sp. TaxID=50421 RepID=UPI003BB55EE8
MGDFGITHFEFQLADKTVRGDPVGELAILPVALPCNMDSYGLIMRSDHVLTPGANRLLGAIRKVASGRH